jgi:hypothetical protein
MICCPELYARDTQESVVVVHHRHIITAVNLPRLPPRRVASLKGSGFQEETGLIQRREF